MALSVVMALWLSLLFKLYQRARLEYQSMITGQGIGRFLPQSLYDQLVNVSFHDWMVNGTFVQENQHYLLYFIPGLSPEQLNQHVSNLLPRHRRALQRPGLGNFLGPQFMRLLVGDQGMAEREGLEPRVVPRRLELEARGSQDDHSVDDEASGFGDDEDGDPAAQFARFWGAEPADSSEDDNDDSPRAVTENSTEVAPATTDVKKIEDDDKVKEEGKQENEEDEEEELEDLRINEQVLWTAAFDGISIYSNLALGFARQRVTSSVGMFSGALVRTTLGVGALAIGAGLFGLWSGHWDRNSMPRMQFGWPSSSILISSTLSSGVTAGLFVMFGWKTESTPTQDGKAKRKSV
jgi:hypothetical protein